jgi:hypothetical protein
MRLSPVQKNLLGFRRKPQGARQIHSTPTKNLVSQPLPSPAPQKTTGRTPGSPHSKKPMLPPSECQPI